LPCAIDDRAFSPEPDGYGAKPCKGDTLLTAGGAVGATCGAEIIIRIINQYNYPS
jgi:hypothetical protein